ncbi:MAG: hypothetical protein U1E22_00950 [Coriobacteriia bacterium]|nr:hypothetical protein [Coriobacteriia bacterium]
MERVHHETARLLQNYTAAVEALLEHTDKIHQRLYEPQLKMQSYSARKGQLRSDPLVSFVKCLRNVLLHGETAKLAFRTEFTAGEVSYSLGLDRSFLDKHSNWWKGPAKTYARNAADFVDIPRLLQDYHAKILGFMDWFASEMRTVSKDDFCAFADGERELFLTQINHMLDCWLRNPDPTKQLAPGDRILFSGLFDEEDFRILEEWPIGSAERADRAIDLLAAHFDVPIELQNKLRLAYMDVNFFSTETLFGTGPSSDNRSEPAPS